MGLSNTFGLHSLYIFLKQLSGAGKDFYQFLRLLALGFERLLETMFERDAE